MKHTILALLVLALAACAKQAEPSADLSHAAPVHAIYDGFAVGDIAAVTAQMSPDIVWNEAENFIYADGNPYIGPDAVVAGVFVRLGSEWTGFSATPVEFIEDGNKIVVLGRYMATNNATGKAVDAQFVHAWTVEDAKVTRFQQYTDTAQFASAIVAS